MDAVASNSTSLDPQNLPPTERATYYHSLRVYLQIIIWKRLSNRHNDLNPQQWDWRLDDDVLIPIIAAAPERLLKFVRCKCKLTSKTLVETIHVLVEKWFEVCNSLWGLSRREL